MNKDYIAMVFIASIVGGLIGEELIPSFGFLIGLGIFTFLHIYIEVIEYFKLKKLSKEEKK